MQPVCGLCNSDNVQGMVMQIDTQQYVCRRCVCEGQRSEIVSLKTFHNARLSSVEESLQAVKKHEQKLVADLESHIALTNDAQAKHRNLLTEHREKSSQLSAVRSQLQSQIDQTEEVKDAHQALASELQVLKLAHSKVKESKADYQALMSKHQATCQRVKLLNTKLQAKHEQFIAANQTAKKLEAERDAAKDWAARETLNALQHRQQKEIAEQQLARETSVLRFCNSKIVKNLKQCEKVKRELEIQLIRQEHSKPEPDGNMLIYVKEMLQGLHAGKQKIAKDVKVASIDMDWKTGALLTQFFQEEQILLMRSNGIMLEPDGARGYVPIKRIRYSDPIRIPPGDVNVKIMDDSDNDSVSTASVE